MKQIINISLGGRNIAIEDTAYEKIKIYTDSLRVYFKTEQGCDEIIADIEARFAELMSDKIKKGAAHITDADVETMIATMGRPEDFEAQNDSATQAYTHNSSFTEKRRLYRDESNKILGGVCSGIANWLNIDPTVVRILFAIVSFGGFGTGILIYIALWIFLPAQNMAVYKGKRMFRDPDNKWLGGVAGGMGAYFNINTNTVRGVMALPLIFSMLKGINVFGWNNNFEIFPNLLFNGLTGTFVFIYIVLWIILPEARTPYQKMEMRGKSVGVNDIKENVQNSMGDINQRLKNWSKEVQESAEKLGTKMNEHSSTKKQDTTRRYTYIPPQRNRGIGYAIAMVFKAFFVIIGGIIALSLLAVLLTLLFSGVAWMPANNFLWTSETQQMLGWSTLILFFGTPIVGLVVWLTRKILNVHTPGNYLNWTFGGLWTIGWVCLMFFIASVSNDFKRYESIEEPTTITQPTNNTLMFKVSKPELVYEGNFGWLNESRSDLEGFSIVGDSLMIAAVKIDFRKSEDSLYHITVVKQSMGKTDEEALARSKKIQYTFNQSDSVIDLAAGFAIDKNSKFRGQNVVMLVQVPVGKKINIDETVFDKLSTLNFEFNNRKRRSENYKYITQSIRSYSSNTNYIMQSDGSLKSEHDVNNVANGSPSNPSNDHYRWDGDKDSNNTNDKDNLNTTPAKPDTASVYHYNESPSKNKSTENLSKELEQKQKELLEKQKEIEAIMKKFEQQ